MSTAAANLNSNTQLVLRAQLHRSRYYPGDSVKCNLHVHAQPTGRWSAGPLGNSTGTARVSGAVSSDAGGSQQLHLYDPERMYPDPLMLSESHVASSSTAVGGGRNTGAAIPLGSSALTGGAFLNALTAQLVCCCFADSTRLLDLASTNVDGIPFQSREQVAASGLLSSQCLDIVTSADVCGRHENFYVLHASPVSVLVDAPVQQSAAESTTESGFVDSGCGAVHCDPVSSSSIGRQPPYQSVKFLRFREPLAYSLLFKLPSSTAFPSFRGNAFRSSYFIVAAASWSTSNGTIKTTHVRVPVRVGGVQFTVERPPLRLNSLPLALQRWLSRHVVACELNPGSQGGEFMQLPARPSPAVCPPLDDDLVRLGSDMTPASIASKAATCSPHTSCAHLRSDHGESSSLRTVGSPVRDDFDAYRRLFALSKPTDFIIRYQDIHTMNLYLESSVVTVGGYLRGALVHNIRGLQQLSPPSLADKATTSGAAVAAETLRVGVVTMTIEAYETTHQSNVRSGVQASPFEFPKYLFEAGEVSQTGTGRSGHVLLSTTIVEEREWFVHDVLQMPFDVCLSSSKFQQTLRTSCVSLDWMVRWRFSCVTSESSTNRNGAIGAAGNKRRLKDLYQELVVPLLILPTPNSGNPRMGPNTFGM